MAEPVYKNGGTKANLRHVDDARSWIKQNFDRDYYDQKFRECLFLLCGNDAYNNAPNLYNDTEDGLADYWDLSSRMRRVGRSNKPLTDLFIAAARIMSEMPEPVSEDTDETTSIMRAKMFLRRAEGTGYGDGAWLEEIQKAGMELIALGRGFVMGSIEFHPRSGLPYTVMTHIPLIQVVTERMVTDPSRSPAAATVTWCSVDEAKQLFGDIKDEDISTRTALTLTTGTYGPLETKQMVRVVTYTDVGIGGNDPTRFMWVGSMNSEPRIKVLNTLGRCHVASASLFQPPLVRDSVGTVAIATGSAVVVETMEDNLLADQSQGGGVTILGANAPDLNVAIKNRQRFVIADGMDESRNGVLADVPPRPLDPNVTRILDYFRQDAEASGFTSPMDMNRTLPGDQTAFEAKQVADRSDTRMGFVRDRFRVLTKRVAELAYAIMGQADLHPCPIEIQPPSSKKTVRLIINGEDLRLMARSVFAEESRITIGTAAMTPLDDRSKKRDRINELSLMKQLGMVGPNPGQVSEEWFNVEILELLGVEDQDGVIIKGPAVDPQAILAAQGVAPDQPGIPPS